MQQSTELWQNEDERNVGDGNIQREEKRESKRGMEKERVIRERGKRGIRENS